MLTEKQQKIYDWLDSKLLLPVHAEAYKGAVHLLKEKSPGYVTFVSHAGRDIINTLASIVISAKSPQVQYVYLVNELKEKWQDEWHRQVQSSSQNQKDGHVISDDVYDMITNLIEEHKEGRIRSQKADERFFYTFLGGCIR